MQIKGGNIPANIRPRHLAGAENEDVRGEICGANQ